MVLGGHLRIRAREPSPARTHLHRPHRSTDHRGREGGGRGVCVRDNTTGGEREHVVQLQEHARDETGHAAECVRADMHLHGLLGGE